MLSQIILSIVLCALPAIDDSGVVELPNEKPPRTTLNLEGSLDVRNTSDCRDIFESEWDDDTEADDAEATVIYDHRRRPQSYRMPGEFERQSGLLVSGRLLEDAPNVLQNLAAATKDRVPLVVLVNDPSEHQRVKRVLAAANGFRNRILYAPHDTIWTRDYGPTVLADGFQAIVVDSAYLDRGYDDNVPVVVARLTNVGLNRSNLSIPGGNLLSNGIGLCITTTQLQVENPGITQEVIAKDIVENYGARAVAMLEPLVDEGTGHVDMFATFTDPYTVVVGEYPRRVDPENCDILNRNAKRLASVRVGNKKLRVVRIPMPPPRDDTWPTFTNVVFANGRLLVPIYESTSTELRNMVHEIYSTLLPGWQIRFIPADQLISHGGALHCVVSNLGGLEFGRIAEPARRELITRSSARGEPNDRQGIESY